MQHQRIYLIKLLKNIMTEAFPHLQVFLTRSLAVKQEELPCILITFDGESIEVQDCSPKTNLHHAKFKISVIFMGEDLEAQSEVLTHICTIEKLLAEQQNNVEELSLTDCSALESFYSGEIPFSSMTLSLEIKYVEDFFSLGLSGSGIPKENALQDLENIEAQWAEDSKEKQELLVNSLFFKKGTTNENH